MKGTVTEANLSKSGKSYQVLIGGQTYFAKLDSKLNAAVGKAIDFSVDPSDYKGKVVNWVKDWDFDREAPAPAAPQVPQVNGKPDRWWINFVSNIVAHSIAAGLIKEPIQLAAWARAAKSAIEVADGNEPF